MPDFYLPFSLPPAASSLWASTLPHIRPAQPRPHRCAVPDKVPAA